MFSVVLLVLVVGSALLVRIATFSSVNVDKPYSIFILAGQSNAEGSQSFRYDLPPGEGIDNETHPADTETGFWWAGATGSGPDASALLFPELDPESDSGWQDSGNVMRDMTGDFPQLKDQFGSELAASRAMYDAGRRKVVFLKVTYGFQPLAQSTGPFVPYDWNINSNNKSYDRLKEEFAELTNYIRSEGSTYTVDGFFWLQGGTDTLQKSMADQYESNFRDLVQQVKTDFEFHPDARFVSGLPSLHNCVRGSYPLGPGEYCGGPYGRQVSPSLVFEDVFYAHPLYELKQKTVRDAIQSVADDDPIVEVVDTIDLSRAWDWIHENYLGQIEIGKRFANMYELPMRVDSSSNASLLTDYDNDGIKNADEDTGRGTDCANDFPYTEAGNSNLGDDDTDCDGYPNYLDKFDNDGVSNGL